MNATLLAIDPAGHTVLFAFLVALAAGLGTGVWWLLRRPAARRPQFQGFGSASRGVAWAAALAVALPIVAYAYAQSWRHFYGLELADGRLEARFYFPARTVRIGAVDRVRVSTQSAFRRGGTMYRLVLRAPDGRRFTSPLMNRSEMEAALNHLERVRTARGRSVAP